MAATFGQGSGNGPGYETRDLALRPVLLSGAVLLVVTALCFALMWGLFRYFDWRAEQRAAKAHPLAAAHARKEPPEPRLQTDPIEDLRALHAWEDGVLTSYAWVDRKKGVVRIPIDRAMELVVERRMTGAPFSDEAGSREGTR